ncbi:MAG: type IV secretory system conjugative DNA transfer family protein, partial [Clostridia bacterium]
ARSLLEGLIGFYLEEFKLDNIKREQMTMTSIRKFQNSSMEERNFKRFKDYIESKEYGLKSKDSLTSIFSASENTYKSVTAVFGEKMALFDDVNVANVTSKSDFNFDILGKESTVLYVIVPDEDKTYYSLVTIIVGLLYRELVKLANNSKDKKLPVQIDFLLDEFANCPPLADIESIVSVARSRGMRFQFFIQSLSQLDSVYGKEVSQIILDNCGLVYLKTNTQETAEAISKRLGKKTIESNSISQSVSLLNYNGNKSTSLIGRDLLTPDEIKQLHYKTIIFPTIGHPIFRDTVIYQKITCYSSGEVKRDVKSLKDLKDTYYTVENIKQVNRRKRYPNNEMDKEVNEFYEEHRKYEISKYSDIEELMKKVFEDKEYKLEYKEENNRTYASISINQELNNRETLLIKNEINSDIYQVDIDLDDNGKRVIEIHFKSPFELIKYD